MKEITFQRSLELTQDVEAITKLEAFVEKVCDDHHIYDAYFGNIMASNSLLQEIFMEQQRVVHAPITVGFTNNPAGMYFSFLVGGCFLDLAALFQKVQDIDLENSLDADETEQKALIVKFLSDKVHIVPEMECIQLVFFINGINEALTQQRIELLESYYSRQQVAANKIF